MKYAGIFIAFFAVFLFAFEEFADAKRFGGGSRVGKSAVSGSSSSGSSGFSSTAGATASNIGSSFGKTGLGIAGGLLAGTMIGSMLGGVPYASGGFLDILLLLVLGFIGYKIYKNFTAKSEYEHNADKYGQNNLKDRLQNNQSQHTQAQNFSWNKKETQQENIRETYGIDTHEFVEGAKELYRRMQDSWNKRDLDDIEKFTTAAVYNEIEKQANEDRSLDQVQVLNLEAQLENIDRNGTETRISVLFIASLKERKDQVNAETVKEIWSFGRENDAAMWKLDGIQQV